MFHEMPLKLYFMKCFERKLSRCILAFSRDPLRFIFFDVIIRQRLKKSLNLFFSRTNEIKACGLAQQLILGMLRDLILQSRDFQSLNGDPPYSTTFCINLIRRFWCPFPISKRLLVKGRNSCGRSL